MAVATSSSNTMNGVPYKTPTKGASLMLAFRPQRTLIVGASSLAASRAFSALEADSEVTILARGGLASACEELRWRADRKELEVVDFSEFSSTDDVSSFEAYLTTIGDGNAGLLFITDTLISGCSSIVAARSRRSLRSARDLYDIAHRHGVSVNTADMPDLCDFTVCSSHRFNSTSGDSQVPGSLQVGVTTNGRGCRLGARIRREIAARLPKDVGVAAARVGELKEIAKVKDWSVLLDDETEEEEANEDTEPPSPNRPVEQLKRTESDIERIRRRMRWVAQVSEYWSFEKLASLSQSDMHNLLDSAISTPPLSSSSGPTFSQHGFSLLSSQNTEREEGRVLLVGSGPGHPSLLSLAAHAALTKHADMVLTDKLVPSAVLALIPPSIPVTVARKFPGNAERAQEELMQLALLGAREGKTVVRLKQGDPALYGRVGEEVLFLRKHGVKSLVIPGISSALAAPLVANIPVTQRGAADSLVVCTGVGRGGKKGNVPRYERGRTVILLMGNARLSEISDSLLATGGYPPHLPAAIVERASMPDQRVLMTRLDTISDALVSLGEQRPPGLLVVGWAACSLHGEGNLDVLEEQSDIENGKCETEKDEERVARWLGDDRWRVSEGMNSLWSLFDDRSYVNGNGLGGEP